MDENNAKLFGDSFYFGKTGQILDEKAKISGRVYLNALLSHTGYYSSEYENYKKSR